MRLKAKAKPVDLARLNRGSLITRVEAVRLIAQTIRREGDSNKQARNRVRQHFVYAAEKNHPLPELKLNKFVFGELVAWAQDEWPGKLDHWSAMRQSTGKLAGTLDDTTLEARAVALPPDLPACHERIKALSEENAALRQVIEKQQAELADLRAYRTQHEGRVKRRN